MTVSQKADGEIVFSFEKSSSFRVMHVDGAVGSVAPSLQSIHMSVYSERAPIPQRVVHLVAQGVLGKEILEKRVMREGVYREIEADLVMSIETAIAINSWLSDRISEAQALKDA